MLSSATGLAQKHHFPGDETAEERYWKKLHAEESKQDAATEQWEDGNRERVQASLPELLKAADKLQADFLRIEDAHLYVPVEPSFFERYPDHVRLFIAATLLLALSTIIILRHREGARIRALCGGFLSDGTEVSKYRLPAWFAPPLMPMDPVPGDDLTLHGNKPSSEVTLPPMVVEFFARAPGTLASIRKILKELGDSADKDQLQSALTKAHELICELRDQTRIWELRPAWQMSSAVELLLKRTVERPKDATPSVLRSLAAAVDVLHEVCVPGIRPNLLNDPPIRILAVDDVELCRRALKYALEKANLTPDLAESGERALELAKAHTYDIVFMDIQMPGMDGLTACTQIQQTKKNADVPVIFVTVQSDFHTRAQSRLKGGTDLMAKPYLVFELTVRAMTFAMRRRLQLQAGQSLRSEPTIAITSTPIVQLAPTATIEAAPNGRQAEVAAHKSVQPAVALPKFDRGFLADVPHCLDAMQATLEMIVTSEPSEARQSNLGRLRVWAETLATRPQLRDLSVTIRVSTALAALLKKLHENPTLVNESTLHTVANALTLLGRLCVPDAEQKLADHSPLQILVVEDEPLSRRAVVGALQLAFDRATSAEDGIAALALTEEKSFDVIFTDVEMPRMDGFELCSRLRAGGHNCNTPIVFITGLKDTEVRLRATQSGGSDFITKPFLPIEIAVKALSFAWEGRLRKVFPPGVVQPPVDVSSVPPARPAALSAEAAPPDRPAAEVPCLAQGEAGTQGCSAPGR